MASQSTADWSKTVLSFNGHEYHLAQLLKTAATGPKIEVKFDEIDLGPKDQLSPELKPLDMAIHEESVVFVKHDNKYICLAGRNRIHRAKDKGDTVVKGNLLSTPALKKSRIVKDAPPAATQPTAMASAWPASNTYDRGQPRKPYNGPSRYR